MHSFLTHHRRKVLILTVGAIALILGLIGQLGYLMIVRSEYYSELADELHERERTIKAARGEIVDRNGTVIATNRTVCTVSVIYNQMEERERIIEVLCKELDIRIVQQTPIGARFPRMSRLMPNLFAVGAVFLLEKNN